MAGLLLSMALAVYGCRSPQQDRVSRTQVPRGPLQPSYLSYSDSDSFDLVLETSLVNQEPAIIINTGHEKPDWGGRLNAWIAAWNMGNKGARRNARGQIPLTTATIDADFVREFRILVFGVVDKAEDLARSGPMWWREERTRSRRVELLRPYSLRFHVADDMMIRLVFFNGAYASRYAEFMKTMTAAEEGDWQRSVECSMSVKSHETYRMRPTDGTSPVKAPAPATTSGAAAPMPGPVTLTLDGQR